MKTWAIYRYYKGRKNKQYSLYDVDNRIALLENKNIKVVLDAVRFVEDLHIYYIEENARDQFVIWDWSDMSRVTLSTQPS